VTTSTIPVLPCDDPILHLPPLLNIPLQLIPGSSSCGGPALSPDATSPTSGTVFDGANHALGDLGTNCLYVGGGNTALPPIEIPDGGELIATVRGLRGSRAIIGASDGTGPADCSRGAGPGSHCLNGAPGTNGSGACHVDTDCGGAAGTCGLDANCFLAPPLPIHVASLGLDVCAANVLLADVCGELDILGFETTVNAALGTRAYLAACPTCVDKKCQGGARNGLSCKAGPTGTSVDCLPAGSSFVGTAVAAATLTSEPLTLANSAGNFCPGQPSPGAFGLPNARRIRTDGRRPNLLTLEATLTGPFCVHASGAGLLDGVVGLSGPAAASMKARVDLLTLLRLFGR
jgi:hypothetical protein